MNIFDFRVPIKVRCPYCGLEQETNNSLSWAEKSMHYHIITCNGDLKRFRCKNQECKRFSYYTVAGMDRDSNYIGAIVNLKEKGIKEQSEKAVGGFSFISRYAVEFTDYAILQSQPPIPYEEVRFAFKCPHCQEIQGIQGAFPAYDLVEAPTIEELKKYLGKKPKTPLLKNSILPRYPTGLAREAQVVCNKCGFETSAFSCYFSKPDDEEEWICLFVQKSPEAEPSEETASEKATIYEESIGVVVRDWFGYVKAENLKKLPKLYAVNKVEKENQSPDSE